MPTYEAQAVFLANLKAGGAFSPELRVRKLVNTEIWSLTFAKDGRALFRHGNRVAEGGEHIVWEAIGSHAEIHRPKDRPASRTTVGPIPRQAGTGRAWTKPSHPTVPPRRCAAQPIPGPPPGRMRAPRSGPLPSAPGSVT